MKGSLTRAALLPLLGVFLVACDQGPSDFSEFAEARPSTAAGDEASIGDQPVCERCEITIEPLVQIGEVNGSGMLLGQPSSVTMDVAGRFWLTFNDIPPMVFDADGDFLGSVGRRGDGPGEFRLPHRTVPVGDSMLVYDRADRIVVVAPDLSPARSIPVPSLRIHDVLVLDWPNSVLVNGSGRSSDLAGWPLHLVDLSDASDFTVVGSFGGEDGALLPSSPPSFHHRRLAHASSGGAWAINRGRQYRITEWNGEGREEQVLLRDSDLFPEGFDGLNGGPDIAPSPRLEAIHERADNRLWIVGRVPRADFREGWREVGIEELPQQLGGTPVSALPDARSLLHTVVEIIDLETYSVVWRETRDEWIIGFLADGRMVIYEESDDGIPTLHIVEAELAGFD